jgi:hypothetical protein
MFQTATTETKSADSLAKAPEQKLVHVHASPSVVERSSAASGSNRGGPNPLFGSKQKSLHMLRLQSSVGNQAVLRSLSRKAPVMQTRLTVNDPGDRYERGPDRAADQVMPRSPSASHAMSPISALGLPFLQRSCACRTCQHCQDDKEGQRAVQTKVSVGAIGDRYEHEADRIADQVVHMSSSEVSPSAQLGQGDRSQTSPLSHAITPLVSASPEMDVDSLSTLREEDSRLIVGGTGGSPIPQSLRSYMEPRFGADFKAVRLHSGPDSARINYRLHSQAFTYGQDIWLANGESDNNLPLLAHELTHVVQQSPSVIRSVAHPRQTVQRKNRCFGLAADLGKKAKGKGSRTHDLVMAEIAKQDQPGNLFFEVNIPGATSGSVAGFVPDEKAVIGRADFFKADTTIGVKFVGDDPLPEYLASHSDLRIAGGKTGGKMRFPHAEQSAPLGKHEAGPIRLGGKGKIPVAASEQCDTLEAPAICHMLSAPTEIGLGDLKPPDEGEILLGGRQLFLYGKGIEQTSTKVNDFAKTHPKNVDNPKSWLPKIHNLRAGEIVLPDRFQPGNTSATYPVVAYRNGKVDDLATPKPVPAYLNVVFHGDGIWVYEYVPANLPKDASGTAKAQKEPIEKLEGLKAKLEAKPEVKTKRKLGPRPAARARVQRNMEDKNFDYGEWRPKFLSWKNDTEKHYLKSKEAHSAEFLETLIDVQQRSLKALPIPQQADQIAAGERKIVFWDEWGDSLGRLRSLLGGVYYKFIRLYSSLRDKFQKLLPKSEEGAKGGLGGKIIKVGMKILRFIARFIVGEVANRMKEALGNAASNLVHNLFGTEIAEYEKFKDTVNGYIADFQQLVQNAVLEQIEDVIKPFEDAYKEIQQVVSVVSDQLKWVNRLKVLIQLIECIDPPVWGCLWGLLSSELVDAIGGYIAGTCKFRKELAKVLKFIPYVKNLPRRLADFLIEKLMSILPPKVQELIGNPIKDAVNLEAVEGCENYDEQTETASALRAGLNASDKLLFDNLTRNADHEPSPEADAMARLAQKWGKPGGPLPALRDLMKATGFGIALPANLADIQRVDDFLEAIGGDGQAIRRYTLSLGRGIQEGVPTLARMLNQAREAILKPAVTGHKGRHGEPEEGLQQEGGITVLRF